MNRCLKPAWVVVWALCTALLAVSAGCAKAPWLASSAASFNLGFLVGRETAPTVTDTQCFVNKQLVDCATLNP